MSLEAFRRDWPPGSLGASLDHEPQPLQFGTSGRRGLLVHLTQLEVFINALAELEYLQNLSRAEGGIVPGDTFFFANDLRPSSTARIDGHGELAQAIQAAIEAAGMRPVYLGAIPTPALTAYALGQGRGSIMVTGSHIPFDRNGYKTNTAVGELLKHHEAPINRRVSEVRARLYATPLAESPFDVSGHFKVGHRHLPPPDPAAEAAYVRRYVDFLGKEALRGRRLVVYQHSAVGRDLLPRILRELGAEVFEAGRSETFVPIDTENIDQARLAAMQTMVDAVTAEHGPLDALVSTDGDSDRPLILGIDHETGRVRFFGGDLVGMVTAEFLGADAVVVPISCNDAIDRGPLRLCLEPKTRIGSPFVIAGMEAAKIRGKQAVCGWEANGGFLTGSDLRREGKVLPALPTRDAVLPIVSVLAAARARDATLADLFDQLPARYSRAALLPQFPRACSQAIIARYSPGAAVVRRVDFKGGQVRVEEDVPSPGLAELLRSIRDGLARHFSESRGFSDIAGLDYTDGVRLLFTNGEVAHLRPSGNADELRIYAVADTQARADEIAAMAVREPDGLLRSMAQEIKR